jgi:hypothetical protein
MVSKAIKPSTAATRLTMTDIARSIISIYMNAGMDRDAAISATIVDLHREAGLTVKDAWEHVWGAGSYSRMVAQIQTAI